MDRRGLLKRLVCGVGALVGVGAVGRAVGGDAASKAGKTLEPKRALGKGVSAVGTALPPDGPMFIRKHHCQNGDVRLLYACRNARRDSMLSFVGKVDSASLMVLSGINVRPSDVRGFYLVGLKFTRNFQDRPPYWFTFSYLDLLACMS